MGQNNNTETFPIRTNQRNNGETGVRIIENSRNNGATNNNEEAQRRGYHEWYGNNGGAPTTDLQGHITFTNRNWNGFNGNSGIAGQEWNNSTGRYPQANIGNQATNGTPHNPTNGNHHYSTRFQPAPRTIPHYMEYNRYNQQQEVPPRARTQPQDAQFGFTSQPDGSSS